MKRNYLITFIILSLLCSCGVNTNPPSYVKELVVYEEGYQGSSKAYAVYFILADAYGNMTASNGVAYIEFAEEREKTWYDEYNENPAKYKGTSLEKRAIARKNREEAQKESSSAISSWTPTLHSEEEHCIYSKVFYNVSVERFRMAKVGMGPFEREVLLYSLGRISLHSKPNKSHGKVYLLFKTEDGNEIRGETAVYY